MNAQDLEQRARELLAEAFSDAGAFSAADTLLRTAYVTDYKNVVALRAIAAALRQQPVPVDLEQFREAVECWKHHRSGYDDPEAISEADRLLALINNAHQPAPVVDDARMARALEWVQVMAMQDADGSHVPAIQEAIAAYDPNCGARTVRGVDDAMRALAANLVDEVDGLIGESGGVYGLHLNGDPSPWDELLPGGRFERLTSLDNLRAALARAQGVQS